MEKFNINIKLFPVSEQYSRKFKSIEKINKIVFEYSTASKELDLKQIIKEVYQSIDRTIDNIINPYDENDYIRVSLKNELLEREIYLPFRQIKYFNTNQIFDEINKVLQSKKEFILHGELYLNIFIVKEPYIAGDPHISYINLNKWRKNSNKVISVIGDGLCLARAIVLSKAYADGLRGKGWRRLREDTGKIQTKIARQLCVDAGIDINEKYGVLI